MKILLISFIYQASAFEKQGHVTIARLVMKFRGYRRVNLHATHQVGVWRQGSN